jgi:hypothetical protein
VQIKAVLLPNRYLNFAPPEAPLSGMLPVDNGTKSVKRSVRLPRKSLLENLTSQ